MDTAVAEKTERKDVRINLMVERSFSRKIEKAAQALGLSVSAYLRIAAIEKMKKDARADREDDG